MELRTLALGVVLASMVSASARADVEGRAAAAVRSGAAYSTDLFLGAGFDPTASASLAPSAVFDLSLSPRVKLFSQGELAAEHYFETAGTAYVAYAESLLQLRPWKRVYPELLATAQASRYVDLLGPADPENPQLPPVTHSERFGGALALRAYPGPAEVRALVSVAVRTSTGLERYVEYPLTAQLSGAIPLGSTVRVGGFYRFTDNESDAEGFFFHGHELSGFVTWTPVDLVTLHLGAGLRHNWNYDTGERDNLPRASGSLSVKVAGPIYAELAGSAEGLHSLTPDGTVELYSIYGGLRVEGGPWRF